MLRRPPIASLLFLCLKVPLGHCQKARSQANKLNYYIFYCSHLPVSDILSPSSLNLFNCFNTKLQSPKYLTCLGAYFFSHCNPSHIPEISEIQALPPGAQVKVSAIELN